MLADITFESDKTILQTSVDTALLKITSGTKLDYTGTDTAVTLSDGTASMTGGEIVVRKGNRRERKRCRDI